jgi:hypothetical protein
MTQIGVPQAHAVTTGSPDGAGLVNAAAVVG